MTFLRYYIPLALVGKKQGLDSTFYYKPKSNKYNCPIKNIKSLEFLSTKYNFEIKPLGSEYLKGASFFIEAVCANEVKAEKKISLSYMTDFMVRFEKCIDDVDYYVFPSRFYASLGGFQDHPKSVFYGSPKYDIDFNLNEILEKYNLPKNNKYVFIPLPKLRDLDKVDLDQIFNIFRDRGFKIITKTRGKDPYSINSDFHFMDYSWYPHDSMELIYASDMVVNFSSTCTKEVLMLKKKMLNFDIKPWPQQLIKLYECKNFKNISSDFNNKNLINSKIDELLAEKDDFDYYINKFLSTGNASKRIINRLVKNEY